MTNRLPSDRSSRFVRGLALALSLCALHAGSATAQEAPAASASRLSGVLTHLDLARCELVVDGQTYRCDSRALRVTIGGRPADRAVLQVGQPVTLLFDASGAASRRVVAVQPAVVR